MSETVYCRDVREVRDMTRKLGVALELDQTVEWFSGAGEALVSEPSLVHLSIYLGGYRWGKHRGSEDAYGHIYDKRKPSAREVARRAKARKRRAKR
jgi:hypothetical protein